MSPSLPSNDRRAAPVRSRLPRARSAGLPALACLWLLAACGHPTPPTDAPPAPQSATAAPPAAAGSTAPARSGLDDIIQTPQDKARAVEPAVIDAAKQQEQAIDAQAQ